MIFKNKEHLIVSLVKPSDIVLDVGFWGQGVSAKDSNWVHSLLWKRAKDVFAFDLDYQEGVLPGPKDHYFRANAESFKINRTFDVIFAGDLIEHLSNPGLFLQASKQHLKKDGLLIISTPNAFNLFNIAEKISKEEPTVNKDHTCYFNSKTLAQLLSRYDYTVESTNFLFSLGVPYKESIKKRFLNILYKVLSLKTSKFTETLVVVAKIKKS